MKVVNLVAENYKRLKAIDITPEDNMVTISGANAQGKTSVLDAIWAAIGGGDMVKSTGTTKPIRDGQKKACVKVDLGDIVVVRKWTESGSTLTVENKEGAAFKSPQTILDGLIGKIAFDPLAFANMDDRKQRETLLGLVKLDIDLDKMADRRKKVYDSRTAIAHDGKNLAARIDALPPIVEGYDTEVSIPSVMAEIDHAQTEVNKNRIQREAADRLILNVSVAKQNRDTMAADVEVKKKMIEEEIANLLRIDSGILSLQSSAESAKKIAESLVDPDVATIKAKVGGIEERNKIVRNNKARAVLIDEKKVLLSNHALLTEEIESLDEQKSMALKNAQFPIDGLGFSDTGVTYNDIPFSQCSAAERLKTSIAMAMAMNPKLKVLRITDGSLVDKKNMAIIEEMVKANDYQCWIEKVDESGKVGIYIEDGEVK
jgi:hypothetical protein